MSSSIRRKQNSSRKRSEDRPWGYQQSILSGRTRAHMERDVKAGRIPKSALSVRVLIMGRGQQARRPDPANQTGFIGKVSRLFGGGQ